MNLHRWKLVIASSLADSITATRQGGNIRLLTYINIVSTETLSLASYSRLGVNAGQVRLVLLSLVAGYSLVSATGSTSLVYWESGFIGSCSSSSILKGLAHLALIALIIR